MQLMKRSCSELKGCIPRRAGQEFTVHSPLCGNHLMRQNKPLSGGHGQPQPLPLHERLDEWKREEGKARCEAGLCYRTENALFVNRTLEQLKI